MTETNISPQTTSQGLINQTQDYLTDIIKIRDYNTNNPGQLNLSPTIPNFQALTSELNNLLTLCRANEGIVTRILQGRVTGSTVVAGTSST